MRQADNSNPPPKVPILFGWEWETGNPEQKHKLSIIHTYLHIAAVGGDDKWLGT